MEHYINDELIEETRLRPGTRVGESQHHGTPEGWKELTKVSRKVSDNWLD